MSKNSLANFRRRLAKNRQYLWPTGIAVILVVIVLIIVARSGRRPTPAPEGAVLARLNNVSGTLAQSYAANQIPAVKSDDKMFGPASAPLKVFVYEDYTNAYCAALADTLEKIKAEAGDRLAIVVRPFIMKNSPAENQAILAVDCAGQQGKWREMRALLFRRAKNQQLAGLDLDTYAKQIDLDEASFRACLTNEEKSGKIERAVAEAQIYKVQGAPTMFVGGELILGARPYADFVDSNGDRIEGLKTVIEQKLGQS
ncbi:MAG: DsbA family protein [Patescibacteria group bacterium]